MNWIKISDLTPPRDTEILYWNSKEGYCIILYVDSGGKLGQSGFICNQEDCRWIYDDCCCNYESSPDDYYMMPPKGPNKD